MIVRKRGLWRACAVVKGVVGNLVGEGGAVGWGTGDGLGGLRGCVFRGEEGCEAGGEGGCVDDPRSSHGQAR